jgi:hypothetical protein
MKFEKIGLFLSRPVAVLLVLVYLAQSGLLVYLVSQRFDLEKQILFQQSRIGELEEKLQIFKVINDFQIGFSEEEVLELADVIYDESERYQYDPMFVMALILTESSFRKGQTSSVGARGLMQVRPFVGRDVATRAGVEWEGSESLFEPVKNIKLGTLHMFEQILKFGDIGKAILAYNLGETRLRGLIRNEQELPSGYLNKVLDNYRMLKETYKV